MQALACGERVRSGDSLVRPVRTAYRANLAFLDVAVEPLHNRFGWRGGVVVVKQVQIDEVGSERLEGRVQIVRDIRRGGSRTFQ